MKNSFSRLFVAIFCSAATASLISSQAFAVPVAKCTNDTKTVTVIFVYYKNLRSDSVQVSDVTLSIDGKQVPLVDQSDDRTFAEMKLGFVLFADGSVMIVSDLADHATVYNADGNTVATLVCRR